MRGLIPTVLTILEEWKFWNTIFRILKKVKIKFSASIALNILKVSNAVDR